MKNLIISLFNLFSGFISYSQIIEIEFNDYTRFNAGMERDCKILKDSSSYVEVKNYFGGINKYVFDLDKKTAKKYFMGSLEYTKTIIESTKNGNIIFIKIKDKEILTGNNVISNIVLNIDKNDDTNPYFLMYFTSTVTNTTNGTIVYN